VFFADFVSLFLASSRDSYRSALQRDSAQVILTQSGLPSKIFVSREERCRVKSAKTTVHSSGFSRTTLRAGLACVFATVISLVLSGCATARLNQFRSFSQAGIAYTRASQTLTDQVGAAAISADSAILVKNRADLPPDERRKAVTTSDVLLKRRLVILHQLNNHAQLLQSYLQTIADMVDNGAGQGLGSAAKGVYDSLAILGKPLQTATIGKERVADFIPEVINIVVANIKVKALNSELKTRAPLIERELATQEAALNALSKDLEDNLIIKLNISETQDVIGPYVAADGLPSDWPDRREHVLTATVAVQSASDAAGAARALRESFARLVAGTLTEGAISDLIQDINSILDLASKIKGT
jgi:hypothetical protein